MRDSYAGNILEIDLTDRKVVVMPTEESLKREYLGGCGFGARLLYERMPAGADALSPECVVVLSTGPATGTIVPSGAMTVCTTKSPLTGAIIRSVMGGFWGAELKQAGFDVLVLKGASPDWVYLFIDDGRVEFRDARHLCGKTTFEAQAELEKEAGSDVATLVTGPAGEKLVRYACLLSGTRALGRGGIGAVFGSKRLKGVVVRGSKTISVPDARGLVDYCSDLARRLLSTPAGKTFPRYGSTASPASYSALGIFGTRNWQAEVFEGAEVISGEQNMAAGRHVRARACSACVLRSSHVWRCLGGPYAGLLQEGPEYESLWAFGGMCGNDNFESIVAADHLCDAYGLDLITTGATVAFAMECYEKGLLSTGQTDGIPLMFGNWRAILDLIPKIARKEGIGELLAEGSARAAQAIGGDAPRFAVHVKGLEVAGHSARVHKGQAVGYATSNRGGSHQDTRVAPERSGAFKPAAVEGKGRLAKETQDMTTIGDAFCMCRRATEALFGYFLCEEYVDLINKVTGAGYDLPELTRVAERIYTVERMFNVREGFDRSDDTLPVRFLEEPVPEGPNKGAVVKPEELDAMLDEYYSVRGWDRERGWPTTSSLRGLGLGWMEADVPRLG